MDTYGDRRDRDFNDGPFNEGDQGFNDQGFQETTVQDQSFQEQSFQGQQGGYGADFGNTDQQGDYNAYGTGPQGGDVGYDQDNIGYQGGGKPSIGQKIKGELEEVAGKLTRNPGKVERGKEEKAGW
ncbi:uncharacterized protein FIBRA_05705 [Fibroporia radiculosa]|uniref:CsbD-like domain-containing protein n=1 Tax=Fibroporia radiculosa TaxID=599839 RepID=J4H3N8_9APHY|nr:uncharacterized protein FIBRA_05705 [Fibroporia radiculosa]CCM03569.1 predicted protein [Fibroporia radiculosa]